MYLLYFPHFTGTPYSTYRDQYKRHDHLDVLVPPSHPARINKQIKIVTQIVRCTLCCIIPETRVLTILLSITSVLCSWMWHFTLTMPISPPRGCQNYVGKTRTNAKGNLRKVCVEAKWLIRPALDSFFHSIIFRLTIPFSLIENVGSLCDCKGANKTVQFCLRCLRATHLRYDYNTNRVV